MNSPTFFVITPSPVNSPTSALTATPSLPIAVQALIQGTGTPAYDVQIGKLHFSTEINNFQLVSPGTSFHNPIKRVYAEFAYQPIGVKLQWTALWYQNGQLQAIDTKSWQNPPAGTSGIGVSGWERPSQDWLPGNYEVQVFVGTGWRVSGTYSVEGEPPTITPTATLIPTAIPSNTPSRTPVPTSTSLPTSTSTSIPSATLRPTSTRTPLPSATSQPTSTRTQVPTETSLPTSTRTLSPTATQLPSKTPTLRPSATPTFIPSSTPTRTLVPTATHTPSATPTRTPLPTSTSTPAIKSLAVATRSCHGYTLQDAVSDPD